jgi:TonB family protein
MPTTRSVVPTPLFWAAIISVAAHSALVAMPLVRHGGGTRSLDDRAVPIVATLAPTVQSAASALVVPAPLEPISAYVLPAMLPAVVPIPPTPAPQALASDGMQGSLLIEAQTLRDTNRLGDLLARQMNEFPLELDSPVELRHAVVARYPPAALAAGHEGTVIAWILVDAKGNVEEIQVADGSEEFAGAVIAAIRNAHFIPAQQNLVPIRFPISLEFHFATGGAATRPTTAAAGTVAK